MKKRVEKPKAKSVVVKNTDARKAVSRAAAAGAHDPLHDLLRGTHAQKICGSRHT